MKRFTEMNKREKKKALIIVVGLISIILFVIFLVLSRKGNSTVIPNENKFGTGFEEALNKILKKEIDPNLGRKKEKVTAFLVMATGKYNSFIPKQVESFDKYFHTKENEDWMLVYFVSDLSVKINHPNVILVLQDRLQWPFDTMNRNAVYLSHISLLRTFDYLYCIDVDLLWVEHTKASEILPDEETGMVACLHPCKPDTYERRPKSSAYIPPEIISKSKYYAGGFFGGDAASVVTFFQTTIKLTMQDTKNGIIAIWHDESYLNHIFNVLTPPQKAMDYGFIYPRGWNRGQYYTSTTRMIHDHTDAKFKFREEK